MREGAAGVGLVLSCPPGAQAAGAAPASPRGSGCREAAALRPASPSRHMAAPPAVQGGRERRGRLSSQVRPVHTAWMRLLALPARPPGRCSHQAGQGASVTRFVDAGRRLGTGAASAKPHPGRSPGGPARPDSAFSPHHLPGRVCGRGGAGRAGRRRARLEAWCPPPPRTPEGGRGAGDPDEVGTARGPG